MVMNDDKEDDNGQCWKPQYGLLSCVKDNGDSDGKDGEEEDHGDKDDDDSEEDDDEGIDEDGQDDDYESKDNEKVGQDDDYNGQDDDEDGEEDIDGWVRCQLAQSPYSLARGNIYLLIIIIITIIIIIVASRGFPKKMFCIFAILIHHWLWEYGSNGDKALERKI